jgi:hypothetical protein
VLNLGKSGEELFKHSFIPATAFAFAADASFEGSVALQNVEC